MLASALAASAPHLSTSSKRRTQGEPGLSDCDPAGQKCKIAKKTSVKSAGLAKETRANLRSESKTEHTRFSGKERSPVAALSTRRSLSGCRVSFEALVGAFSRFGLLRVSYTLKRRTFAGHLKNSKNSKSTKSGPAGRRADEGHKQTHKPFLFFCCTAPGEQTPAGTRTSQGKAVSKAESFPQATKLTALLSFRDSSGSRASKCQQHSMSFCPPQRLCLSIMRLGASWS